MLLVKTHLASSPIHGLGLFASQDIAKGQPTWKLNLHYCDFIVPDPADVPEPFASCVRHYGYYDRTRLEWIMCGDDGRFINHVLTKYNSILKIYTGPNTHPIMGSSHYWMDIASRDIAAGEELTVDYTLFDGMYGSGGTLAIPDSPVIVVPPNAPVQEFNPASEK